MLEFGRKPATAPAPDLIREASEATFMTEVIEASRGIPVIVDFWATWCGPCKTLTPMLETAVTAARGKVRLVKIDVDRNQRIAAQLRIQSIPTVYGFWQGQPVDGFQGAVPASEVKAFIDRLSALAGDGGLGQAAAAAEAMLTRGDAVGAAETFAAILTEEPEHAGAYAGLVRAHLALGNEEQAAILLANAPAKIAKAAELEAPRAQLELLRQAADAGPVGELRAAVAADPGDLEARFELARALHAAGSVEEAIEELLDLFRRDRAWNEGAAKAQLFTIFGSLKPSDPILIRGRRRLSSMIFA